MADPALLISAVPSQNSGMYRYILCYRADFHKYNFQPETLLQIYFYQNNKIAIIELLS